MRLLFVSPRFLFPADSGGKIRTSQILQGMKGGRFRITLASPKPDAGDERYAEALQSVADDFVGWQEPNRGPFFHFCRMRYMFSSLPIPVATDRSSEGSEVVARELRRNPDLVIFDFPHSAVMAPETIQFPSIVFTHNVEAEIFRRHRDVAGNPLMRWIWGEQFLKMEAYERRTLARFDGVIAVSERDARYFRDVYGIRNVSTIRTGVDLDYNRYVPPPEQGSVVFTGSMDWHANRDAMSHLMEDIWPVIITEFPEVSMRVVGRNPSTELRNKARDRGLRWEFTGFVDDVRPYVWESAVYAVPLRVGGGTRIKIFEALAMGCPIVSTSIGVEGLPLVPDRHFLLADNPRDFADAVVRLLRDKAMRERLSTEGRRYVSENFSSRAVAREFEEICTLMRESAGSGPPASVGGNRR